MFKKYNYWKDNRHSRKFKFFRVFNPFTPFSSYLCHKYSLTQIPTAFWNPAHSCALILNEGLICTLHDCINQITPIPNHTLSMVVRCIKVDSAFLNYVGCSVSWFSPKPTEKEKPGTLVFGHGVVTASLLSCSTVGNEVQPCLGLRDRGLFRQLSPSLTTHPLHYQEREKTGSFT